MLRSCLRKPKTLRLTAYARQGCFGRRLRTSCRIRGCFGRAYAHLRRFGLRPMHGTDASDVAYAHPVGYGDASVVPTQTQDASAYGLRTPGMLRTPPTHIL